MGVSLAFIAADMALAGIESKDLLTSHRCHVPSRIKSLAAFRETAGGLAATPTGRRLQKKSSANKLIYIY